MKPDLLIVDGSSYIFRAYYGVRQLNNSKGVPTNASLGFTKMILRLIDQFKPSYMAIVFDTKEKNFRHEIFPKYKANRDKPPEDLITQIPYIHQITKALNIPTFILPGYEADDIIGTLAYREKNNFNVKIISADKDLMQLVSKEVIMYDPMKDKTYDESGVIAKLGVSPNKVHDFLAITGDSSDNIPGVAKIGPKGACELINEFGSLENIYDNIDKIKGAKKDHLTESKDNAFLSKKLTSILLDVPCEYKKEDLKLRDPNKTAAYELFNELEFKSLLYKFKPDEAKEKISIEPQTQKSNYKTILKDYDFDMLLEKLSSAEAFAFDTETTSLSPRAAKLVGLSFSINENDAYYIPLNHSYLDAPSQLEENLVLNKLKPILENESIKKIGQNIKYDIIVLKNYNINVKNIYFDTMIASYILNPTSESHSLDHLSEVYLNHTTIKYSDVAGKGKTQIPFSDVTIERASEYAAEDSDCTLKLYNLFHERILSHPSKKLFFEIEMPLVLVLANMEFNGVTIDTKFLKNISVDFQKELTALQIKIHDIAKEPFNINSTKQLSYILFEKLGIEPIKKTKTGFSTNYEVLQILSKKHEIASSLLKFREISKLKNTYIDALPELILRHTQKIHTSYNQTVTSTGRLSSSNPNLQNIPIRTRRGEQIRKAFIPSSSDFTLVGADYNQIELRIMAHIANDNAFIEDFTHSKDIHKQTAMRVYNLTEETYTTDHRRNAKAINFGLIYGMGSYSLSQTLGIPVGEAKHLINIYFEKHYGVKKYMDDTIEFAQKNGYVETLFGRRREFPSINDKNQLTRKNSERAAINAPIQGTSADIIKIAMINIQKELHKFDAKMILQVHDELVFEVPKSNQKDFEDFVRSKMEGVIKIQVPLLVDVSSGPNWLEAH